MSSRRNTRNLILILALSIILLSTFAQSVGAPALFDDKVLLQWKSDPALRSFLQYAPTYRRVDVLVVFSTIPSAYEVATLASLCQVNTYTGHVATVSSPVNLLPTLAALPFVSQIAMPKKSKEMLDVSVPEILADQVWNTAKYPGVRDSYGRVVNGTGVIIGFDDVTGIDYQHKDFSFPNGTNKVLYIWDQSSTGTPPEGYTYGNECNPAQIQSQTCAEFDFSPDASDTTGHETAVAAVAASTGQASHNYVGVAPGASIIAVKLEDASDNHVIDAINFMITKARQLNRPIVIVHSFGDSLGSHDGTEPLELAFTDFVSKGVPIVVSAGNDGGTDLHVSGELSPGEAVHVPWSMSGNTNSMTDLWYSVGDLLSLSVVTPSGAEVAGPTSDAGAQTVDGVVIVSSFTRPSGREWWINITATTDASQPNKEWEFVLTSVSGPEGRWDAWTEPGEFVGSNETVAGKYLIDHSDTIDAPGTARGVVTVGAYMTKYGWWAHCTTCVEWAEANGYMGYWWTPTSAPGEGRLIYNTTRGMVTTYVTGGPGVGQILYFSSVGPTRDGRMKPEIDAPGANIAAARAANAPERHSDPDNYHQVWRGTSFAAPHVGGVIALMLQMNPYLSPAEITNILEAGARQDNFTGNIDMAIGSPIWGWGKLNALRSTLDATSVYSVRIQINSIQQPIHVDLSLDGSVVQSIPLNTTITIILEFKKNGNHTIELTPIINLETGTRYVTNGSPWTFSSGGARTFNYQLQYFLRVNSAYGDATGSGWYDANETATASITPTAVGDHQFQGWIGSLTSNSPTVNVTMDSAKELLATWSPGLPTVTQVENSFAISVVGALVALTVILTILVAVERRRSSRRQPPPNPSEDSPPPPS